MTLRCPRGRLRRDPATRAADTVRERGVGGDLRRDENDGPAVLGRSSTLRRSPGVVRPRSRGLAKPISGVVMVREYLPELWRRARQHRSGPGDPVWHRVAAARSLKWQRHLAARRDHGPRDASCVV